MQNSSNATKEKAQCVTWYNETGSITNMRRKFILDEAAILLPIDSRVIASIPYYQFILLPFCNDSNL